MFIILISLLLNLDAGIYRVNKADSIKNPTIVDAATVCERVNDVFKTSDLTKADENYCEQWAQDMCDDETVTDEYDDDDDLCITDMKDICRTASVTNEKLLYFSYVKSFFPNVIFYDKDSKLNLINYGEGAKVIQKKDKTPIKSTKLPTASKAYFCEHIYLPISNNDNHLVRACKWVYEGDKNKDKGTCKVIDSPSNFVRDRLVSEGNQNFCSELSKLNKSTTSSESKTDMSNLLEYEHNVCNGLYDLFCDSSSLKSDYRGKGTDIIALNKPLFDICNEYINSVNAENSNNSIKTISTSDIYTDVLFNINNLDFTPIDGSNATGTVPGLNRLYGSKADTAYKFTQKPSVSIYSYTLEEESSTTTTTKYPLIFFQNFLLNTVIPRKWDNSSVSVFKQKFLALKKIWKEKVTNNSSGVDYDSVSVNLKELLTNVLKGTSVGQYIASKIVSLDFKILFKDDNDNTIGSGEALIKSLFTRIMEKPAENNEAPKNLYYAEIKFQKRKDFDLNDPITKSVLGNSKGMLVYSLIPTNKQLNKETTSIHFVYYEPILSFVPVEDKKILLLDILKSDKAPIIESAYCKNFVDYYDLTTTTSTNTKREIDDIFISSIFNTPLDMKGYEISNDKLTIQTPLTYFVLSKFCRESKIDNLGKIFTDGQLGTVTKFLRNITKPINKEIKKIDDIIALMDKGKSYTDKVRETKLYEYIDNNKESNNYYLKLRTNGEDSNYKKGPYTEVTKDKDNNKLNLYGNLVAPEFGVLPEYSFVSSLLYKTVTGRALSSSTINYKFIINLLFDYELYNTAIGGVLTSNSNTFSLDNETVQEKFKSLIDDFELGIDDENKKILDAHFRVFLSEYSSKLKFIRLLATADPTNEDNNERIKFIDSLENNLPLAYTLFNYSIPNISLLGEDVDDDNIGSKKGSNDDNTDKWSSDRGSGWGVNAGHLLSVAGAGASIYQAYQTYKDNLRKYEELKKMADPCWEMKELDEELGIDWQNPNADGSTQISYYQECRNRLLDTHQTPPELDQCTQQCNSLKSDVKNYELCIRKCLNATPERKDNHIPEQPGAVQNNNGDDNNDRGAGDDKDKDKNTNAGGVSGGLSGGSGFGRGGYRPNYSRDSFRRKDIRYRGSGTARYSGNRYGGGRYSGGRSVSKSPTTSTSRHSSSSLRGVPNIYGNGGYYPI